MLAGNARQHISLFTTKPIICYSLFFLRVVAHGFCDFAQNDGGGVILLTDAYTVILRSTASAKRRKCDSQDPSPATSLTLRRSVVAWAIPYQRKVRYDPLLVLTHFLGADDKSVAYFRGSGIQSLLQPPEVISPGTVRALIGSGILVCVDEFLKIFLVLGAES